jgi:hypothetical protein
MEDRLATCPECGFMISLQEPPVQGGGDAMAFLALCKHQIEGNGGHCPVLQDAIDLECAAGQANT